MSDESVSALTEVSVFETRNLPTLLGLPSKLRAKILKSFVDVNDIDNRRNIRSLLLCNRQIHDEFLTILSRTTLITKVDFECSASLYRALLPHPKLVFMVPESGTDVAISSICQWHVLHMTMKDVKIKAPKKLSFFIIGQEALHEFLDFLACRDPNQAPRFTSIPRSLTYTFAFVKQPISGPKQITHETSFLTGLADIWWEFPNVTFQAALLESLAAKTAQEISGLRGQTRMDILNDISHSDTLAASLVSEGKLHDALGLLKHAQNLFFRTANTSIGLSFGHSLRDYKGTVMDRYARFAKLYFALAMQKSSDTKSYLWAVISNVAAFMKLNESAMNEISREMMLIETHAFRLLGYWHKAGDVIKNLWCDNFTSAQLKERVRAEKELILDHIDF